MTTDERDLLLAIADALTHDEPIPEWEKRVIAEKRDAIVKRVLDEEIAARGGK